jgi:hypothetical protein
MKTKLVLAVVTMMWIGQVHAEVVGASTSPEAVQPTATVESKANEIAQPDASVSDEKEFTSEADEDKDSTPIHRTRTNRHSNKISWSTLKSHLLGQNKNINYNNTRACLWGTNGKKVSDDCMKHAGFCKISTSLERPDQFPVGSMIVYSKNLGGRPLNVIAVKAGPFRYYTGHVMTAPVPSTPQHKLAGVFAPGPCKN